MISKYPLLGFNNVHSVWLDEQWGRAWWPAISFVQQSKGVWAFIDNTLYTDNKAVPCHTLAHFPFVLMPAAAQAWQPAPTSSVWLRTYPEVQLLPDVNGIARSSVWLGEVLTGCSDSVKRNLWETGSENPQVWLYWHTQERKRNQSDSNTKGKEQLIKSCLWKCCQPLL